MRPIPSDWSCDRAVLPEVFQHFVSWLCGKHGLSFTFDAAAKDDGSNAMCARWSSPAHSFLLTLGL
jgi:hypothetical protein